MKNVNTVRVKMWGTTVGYLHQDDNGMVGFQYDEEFLKSSIEISPIKMPLSTVTYTFPVLPEQTFHGLPGMVADSLPDKFGNIVISRYLESQGRTADSLSVIEKLCYTGKRGMGALEYEPAAEFSDLYGDVELDSLSGEVDRILEGEESLILDDLLKLNGSSGGARPKIVAYVSPDRKHIVHGGKEVPEGCTPWIIKFSERHDPLTSGELEYHYSLAAKSAGITMPETHLFPLKDGRRCFGVQRFDRTPKGKVHTHTACGLLHASHRFASLDYENLLKLTWILTKNHADVVEMVRRMIFNVKSGNKDDHSKNFSFLLNEQNQWQLAPAYDLTPSAGINGEQTCMVNGKGRNITDADLIKTAAAAGVTEGDTRRIIEQVNEALIQYKIVH